MMRRVGAVGDVVVVVFAVGVEGARWRGVGGGMNWSG